MFSLGLSTLGFAPSLPTLTGDFCADVVETLTVDGSAPLPGKNYTLCVDKTNVRWNQKGADQKGADYLNIFNVCHRPL